MEWSLNSVEAATDVPITTDSVQARSLSEEEGREPPGWTLTRSWVIICYGHCLCDSVCSAQQLKQQLVLAEYEVLRTGEVPTALT